MRLVQPGSAGQTGAAGSAGQTQVVVQEKVITVEKVVEKVVETQKVPVKLTYLNKHFPGTVNYEWDNLMYERTGGVPGERPKLPDDAGR